MADRYDRSIKVRQSTIDEIKKMGMAKAIEKAKSSSDREFVEGAKRFYGGNRVSGKQPTPQMKRSIDQTRTGKPVSTTPSPEAKSSTHVAAPVSQDAIARRMTQAESTAYSAERRKQITAEEKEKRKKGSKKGKLEEAYRKQKEGSKFKGAFSGLGG